MGSSVHCAGGGARTPPGIPRVLVLISSDDTVDAGNLWDLFTEYVHVVFR